MACLASGNEPIAVNISPWIRLTIGSNLNPAAAKITMAGTIAASPSSHHVKPDTTTNPKASIDSIKCLGSEAINVCLALAMAVSERFFLKAPSKVLDSFTCRSLFK